MAERITPVQAIRLKCIDCCCGYKDEVKRCEVSKCPLHPFRLGKNPNYKKADEEKADE